MKKIKALIKRITTETGLNEKDAKQIIIDWLCSEMPNENLLDWQRGEKFAKENPKTWAEWEEAIIELAEEEKSEQDRLESRQSANITIEHKEEYKNGNRKVLVKQHDGILYRTEWYKGKNLKSLTITDSKSGIVKHHKAWYKNGAIKEIYTENLMTELVGGEEKSIILKKTQKFNKHERIQEENRIYVEMPE